MAKIYDPKTDKSLWETLITGIVRPPRADYRDTQLGKSVITQEQKISLITKFYSPDWRNKSCTKAKKYNSPSSDPKMPTIGSFCISMGILPPNYRLFLS